MSDQITLFDEQDADGNGTAHALKPFWRDRPVSFYAWGTFGSGTCKLQASIDGTTWFDVPSASHTAAGLVSVSFSARFVRAVLSGATAPSVSAAIL